jgi:hypothetical protein
MSVYKAEKLYVNIVTYKLKDIAVKPAYVVTHMESTCMTASFRLERMFGPMKLVLCRHI